MVVELGPRFLTQEMTFSGVRADSTRGLDIGTVTPESTGIGTTRPRTESYPMLFGSVLQSRVLHHAQIFPNVVFESAHQRLKVVHVHVSHISGGIVGERRNIPSQL